MKLKKPAKDHRGEWDLVLDNDGTTVASMRYRPRPNSPIVYLEILWPMPSYRLGSFEWRKCGLFVDDAVTFFKMLGVDTAPLEKLTEEA